MPDHCCSGLTRTSLPLLLIGLLMLETPAQAGSQAPRELHGVEQQVFMERMQANLRAWSFAAGDARFDEAGPDYTRRPDAVFMDPIPPLAGYRGWEEYRHAVPTWVERGIRRATFAVSAEEFRAWRDRDVVWNIMRCSVALTLPDDTAVEQECRGTTIWEWEGDDWRLAHEHFSVPAEPGGVTFSGPHRADPRIEAHPQFLSRARRIASAWGEGSVHDLAARLEPYYVSDATMFTPWNPLQAYAGWGAFEAGVATHIAAAVRSITITVNDDLEAHQRGQLAWSHATLHLDIVLQDGSPQSGDARQTLIWLLTPDGWRIVHEHFSYPQDGTRPVKPVSGE